MGDRWSRPWLRSAFRLLNPLVLETDRIVPKSSPDARPVSSVLHLCKEVVGSLRDFGCGELRCPSLNSWVPGKRALSSPEGHAPAACDRGRDESRGDLKPLHREVSRGRNWHLPLLEAIVSQRGS